MSPAEYVLHFKQQQRRHDAVRWYARGRTWAEGKPLVDLFASALRPWSGLWSVTTWPRTTATYTGTLERPGRGTRETGTLAQHAEWRAKESERVVKKGEHWVISHGLSAHAGGSDPEATARTGVLLDYDGGDGAGWDKLSLLGPCARIGQRRPIAGKYHIELPFAEIVELAADGADKPAWSQQLGWVLGCMSELVFPADASRRFDPLTNRLLQPVFIATRREVTDPVPETYANDSGVAVDWYVLLQAFDFPVDKAEQELSERDSVELREPIDTIDVDGGALINALKDACATVGEGEGRWRMYLALAGALKTHGVQRDDCVEVLEGISRRARVDDEAHIRNRVRCAMGTYDKPDRYIGFNTLRQEFPTVALALKKYFQAERAKFSVAFGEE